MFTSSDPSADHLSVTFASGRVVLSYDGSFSALRPAEVRQGDRGQYAGFILEALERQHASDAASNRLYGYDWRDDTRSTPPRATLTIARSFGQYTVNIANIHLTPRATVTANTTSSSSASSTSSSSPTYCRSLFPLLQSVRTGIIGLGDRNKRHRDRMRVQQEQLSLIDLMLTDESTEAEAVEEEWLGVCMRLLNAEKARIREMRAKTEQVQRETAALTAKEVVAAKAPQSDSDSDIGEVKEVERVEVEDATEMKDDEEVAAAADDGPALSYDSNAMELSLHPDSTSPPQSLNSMPSLQPDSNANSLRSSSTTSSLSSSISQSRMSSSLLDSGEPSRRSVRKRARMQPPTISASSAALSDNAVIPATSLSLSSSLNGANRLLPPLSSADGKGASSTVRAPSPAASVNLAVRGEGRQTGRQGVTGLLDEL